MENPFKKLGFRNFSIQLMLFVGVAILIDILITGVFRNTLFFKNNLLIPKIFVLSISTYKVTAINAIIFGIIAFIILTYKKLLDIKKFSFKKYQIIYILLAVITLFFQYYFRFMIVHNIEYFLQNTLLWGIVKIAIMFVYIILLAIGIFGFKFINYFFQKYKKQILISATITIAFFFLMLLVQNLWSYFSNFISNVLYHIFNIFFSNVTYKPFVSSFTMTEGGGPLLGINGFKAIIGKPCSGIDSFLLFTSLYSLIFILDYKRLKKPLTILLFAVGAIGMFLTNLIRIFLLFIVGAYIDAKFAIGMFHSNIGWILFIIYFFIFWYFASKVVYKK